MGFSMMAEVQAVIKYKLHNTALGASLCMWEIVHIKE